MKSSDQHNVSIGLRTDVIPPGMQLLNAVEVDHSDKCECRCQCDPSTSQVNFNVPAGGCASVEHPTEEESGTWWPDKPESFAGVTQAGAKRNAEAFERPMRRVDLTTDEADAARKTYATLQEQLINQAYPDDPDTDPIQRPTIDTISFRSQFVRSGYRWRLDHPGCRNSQFQRGADLDIERTLDGAARVGPLVRRCYQESYILWLRVPVGGRQRVFFDYPGGDSSDAIPEAGDPQQHWYCFEHHLDRRLQQRSFAHGGKRHDLGGQFVINFLRDQRDNEQYEELTGEIGSEPYGYAYPGQVAQYIRNLCRIWVWRSEIDAFYCYDYPGQSRFHLTFWARWWAEAEAWWDDDGVLTGSRVNGGLHDHGPGDSVNGFVRAQMEQTWEDVFRMDYPARPEVSRRVR